VHSNPSGSASLQKIGGGPDTLWAEVVYRGPMGAMGAVAEIIKVDADILSLQTKLKDKNSPELRARLEELRKRREKLILEVEKQARDRLR